MQFGWMSDNSRSSGGWLLLTNLGGLITLIGVGNKNIFITVPLKLLSNSSIGRELHLIL